MTVKEIIDGLKFTVDMFLLNPTTGETFTEPKNDMDKTTIDACKGAIELLEQIRWIPVSERLPKVGELCLLTVHEYGWNCNEYTRVIIGEYNDNYRNHILAWMPLPEPYEESEG